MFIHNKFFIINIQNNMNGFFKVPTPVNEPVLNYAPGSKERKDLKDALAEARAKTIDIPMYIGGSEVRSGNTMNMHPPHDHQHLLGQFHVSDASHVTAAINAALAAKPKWEALTWEQRAAIFLKAADLIAGPYRAKLNAATMLAQSKNIQIINIDSFQPVDWPERIHWPNTMRWPVPDTTFCSWAIAQKFLHTDNGHFDRDAHSAFADYVLKNIAG